MGITRVTAKKTVFLSSQDGPGEQGAAGGARSGDGAGTAAGRAGCPRTGSLGDEMQTLGVSCNGVPFYLKTTKPLIRIFFLHLALEKKKLKMYKPLCTAYVYFIAV